MPDIEITQTDRDAAAAYENPDKPMPPLLPDYSERGE